VRHSSSQGAHSLTAAEGPRDPQPHRHPHPPLTQNPHPPSAQDKINPSKTAQNHPVNPTKPPTPTFQTTSPWHNHPHQPAKIQLGPPPKQRANGPLYTSLGHRPRYKPGPKALPCCRRPEWRRSRNDQIAFFNTTHPSNRQPREAPRRPRRTTPMKGILYPNPFRT
jgi:hypothetical protein